MATRMGICFRIIIYHNNKLTMCETRGHSNTQIYPQQKKADINQLFVNGKDFKFGNIDWSSKETSKDIKKIELKTQQEIRKIIETIPAEITFRI
jgi:hypothetical protein